MNNINKRKIYIIYISALFLAGLLYWSKCIFHLSGDYYAHIEFTKLILNNKMTIMYPGFHYSTAILHILFGIPVEFASSIVLTIAWVGSIFATHMLLCEIREENHKNYSIKLLLLSVLINIVQPIFTYSIRPGYSSGNGYISPTQAACKPFIILSVCFFYKSYKNNKWTLKNQILLTLMLVLSCIFKPFFAMAFIPAIGLMILVEYITSKHKEKHILLFIKKLIPLFISGIVLLVQFILSLNWVIPLPEYAGVASSKICIGWFVSWRLCVSNVFLSIIFAYAFPIVLLIYILINKFKYRNIIINTSELVFGKISLYYGMISFLYMAFLYQNNGYEKDCNFRNAWVVTYILVYTLCTEILFRILKNQKKKHIYLLFGILSIHLFFGIILLAKNIVN